MSDEGKIGKSDETLGSVYAARDINLDINDGEFVAFLGPSGCGKTTTLLLIAGIYKPTAGRILFDDRVMNQVPPKNRNIGMVFQSYALYPHMTVYENLVFPMKLKRVPPAEMKARPTSPRCWASANCSIVGPASCPAGSNSAWRWGGP